MTETVLLTGDIILTDVELDGCVTREDVQRLIERKVENLRSSMLRRTYFLRPPA